MRISDWSSDVCSSDLAGFPIDNKPTGDTFPVLNNVGRFWISDIDQPRANIADSEQQLRWHRGRDLLIVRIAQTRREFQIVGRLPVDLAECGIGLRDRQSVGEGKSVSVRVERGGRRIMKKKKKKKE